MMMQQASVLASGHHSMKERNERNELEIEREPDVGVDHNDMGQVLQVHQTPCQTLRQLRRKCRALSACECRRCSNPREET